MTKDRSERRAYRRSPGRQYWYDYDPLHNQNDNRPGHIDHFDSSQPGSRPDPHRARQLLRQNILASKSRTTTNLPKRPEESRRYSSRPIRNPLPLQRYTPVLERYTDVNEDVAEEKWDEYEMEYLDPDLGYEEEDPFVRDTDNIPSVQLGIPRRISQPSTNRYRPRSRSTAPTPISVTDGALLNKIVRVLSIGVGFVLFVNLITNIMVYTALGSIASIIAIITCIAGPDYLLQYLENFLRERNRK